MDNEIQLISDGDGLAVIGEPKDVETFLRACGMSRRSSISVAFGHCLLLGLTSRR